MKFLPSQLLFFFQNRTTRKNIAALSRFFLFVTAIITIYSLLFHQIMLYEERNYSWITGLYWTLTVMSTLGFGDITFTSDMGLIFTIIVLVSGIVLLLIILPFTFIQFFYAPWLDAHDKSRTPRELPKDTQGHIIITGLDPITTKLIDKLQSRKMEYVLLVTEMQRAIELYDMGYRVVLGEHDDTGTYRRLRAENASLIVATNDDLTNTSIAFSVRGLTQKVPIVLSADSVNSLDILQFPGNTHVFLYHNILGQRLAERTIGLGHCVNIVSQLDTLIIAELASSQTNLQGWSMQKLWKEEAQADNRPIVIGIWEAGTFLSPEPQCIIGERSLILLAGSITQIDSFERRYTLPKETNDTVNEKPVVVLGGGRVGQAVARTLRQHSIRFRIVEKLHSVKGLEMLHDEERIIGDAADINVLKQAGIAEARTVIITTRSDAMNMYLSFYCRQLRPTIQVISRATNQRSVPRLHMAGADITLSYASMGANSIINLLHVDIVNMLTEGLDVFSRPVPLPLAGKNLKKSHIREKSGCSVIAIRKNSGEIIAGPHADSLLTSGDELILIGSSDSEHRFLNMFEQG